MLTTMIILGIAGIVGFGCVCFLCGVKWSRNQQLKEQEYYNSVVSNEYLKQLN